MKRLVQASVAAAMLAGGATLAAQPANAGVDVSIGIGGPYYGYYYDRPCYYYRDNDMPAPRRCYSWYQQYYPNVYFDGGFIFIDRDHWWRWHDRDDYRRWRGHDWGHGGWDHGDRDNGHWDHDHGDHGHDWDHGGDHHDDHGDHHDHDDHGDHHDHDDHGDHHDHDHDHH